MESKFAFLMKGESKIMYQWDKILQKFASIIVKTTAIQFFVTAADISPDRPI